MTRRVCFVTGTRAEFGLMATTLRAVRSHAELSLQLIVTGMHLSAAHGQTIETIRNDGWQIDAVVDWPMDRSQAVATGLATAGLAEAFDRLKPDIVLVVGDRVEAFAAATATHLSDLLLAHVHGGDRAMGQMDDALRHAITKLAHVHLCATPESADRIFKLGEQPERIIHVGAPGIDGINALAAPPEAVSAISGTTAGRFALIVLHPTRDDEAAETATARRLVRSVLDAEADRLVVVRPNNDPGFRGIVSAWDEVAGDRRVTVLADAPRPLFLGLLRDAAFLAGNSSSGIIEAASFGTRVLDIGPRQSGRERADNVLHVEDEDKPIRDGIAALWQGGHPTKWSGIDPYGGDGAGRRIADALAKLDLQGPIRRKLIRY